MRYIEGQVGQEMLAEGQGKPHPHQMIKCPRCESVDTKFCYFNNYSTTQPRYFCKNCKRYWTNGGALRNVPVGGGLRKNKRSKHKTTSSSSTPHQKPSTSSSNTDDHNSHGLPNPNPGYPPSPSTNNYLFNPRIYETGDQPDQALSYYQFNYKNMPQVYPGYSYPPPLSMEGLHHHTEGGFGAVYNLLDPSRSQSNSGETSEVSVEPRSEAMKTAQFAPPSVAAVGFNERSYGLASDHTTREGSIARSLQQGFHYEDASTAREDPGHKDSNNNYSNMQSLGYGNDLQQGKWRGRRSSTDGMLNLDASTAHSEEGLTNVVNVHDWQQISEGLFGGAGDFYYMPTPPS